jgi:hypothetical protein
VLSFFCRCFAKQSWIALGCIIFTIAPRLSQAQTADLNQQPACYNASLRKSFAQEGPSAFNRCNVQWFGHFTGALEQAQKATNSNHQERHCLNALNYLAHIDPFWGIYYFKTLDSNTRISYRAWIQQSLTNSFYPACHRYTRSWAEEATDNTCSRTLCAERVVAHLVLSMLYPLQKDGTPLPNLFKILSPSGFLMEDATPAYLQMPEKLPSSTTKTLADDFLSMLIPKDRTFLQACQNANANDICYDESMPCFVSSQTHRDVCMAEHTYWMAALKCDNPLKSLDDIRSSANCRPSKILKRMGPGYICALLSSTYHQKMNNPYEHLLCTHPETAEPEHCFENNSRAHANWRVAHYLLIDFSSEKLNPSQCTEYLPHGGKNKSL